MQTRIGSVIAAGVLAAALVPITAEAQAPAPAGPAAPAAPAAAQAPAMPAPVSVAVANPTYNAIHMEIDVNRPAAEVWKRVGKYCDIGEWLQIADGCKITAGKDDEFGSVRSVAREVLV